MTAHGTDALANGIDGLLLLAAVAAFALRRSRLTTVTLLLAAAPLWAQGAAALHITSLGRAAAEHAAELVATTAPVWAAFAVGLPPLLRADGGVAGADGR